MWFKVDDTAYAHPKMLAAGNAAIGLWVRAGAWSAFQLTNGFVPRDVLRTLGATPRQVNALVNATGASKRGLWIPERDGWSFHDWADYQPDAEEYRAERDEDRLGRRRGGSLGNHRRWHVNRHRIDPDCPFCQADTQLPFEDQDVGR